MNIKDKLDLMNLSKEFEVNQHEDGSYEIVLKGSNLVAFISLGEDQVNYYVTGVYNSCSDYERINMLQLEKLKKFVEFLMGE